uniref:Uncharacterized protein n=1 Tax=Opuntia streptacantha TaxID=393608 RepID=A0A7C9DF41_OPUST
MENRSREMGRGWPLGLGSIYLRLRLVESLPVSAAAATTAEPRSLFINVPSNTLSSCSSSNFDTESTVSFFQDNSKTLGRLMGFRPRHNRRSEVYNGNSIHALDLEEEAQRRSFPEHQIQCSDGFDNIQMCKGFCVPLCILSKTTSSKVTLKELN